MYDKSIQYWRKKQIYMPTFACFVCDHMDFSDEWLTYRAKEAIIIITKESI